MKIAICKAFFMIFNSFLASNIGLHTAVPPISLWMLVMYHLNDVKMK